MCHSTAEKREVPSEGKHPAQCSEGEASDYRKSLRTDLHIASSTHTFAPPTPRAQPCLARRSIAQTPRLARLCRTRTSHCAPAVSVRGPHLRPSTRSYAAAPDRRPSSEVRRDALVSGARASVGILVGRGGSCAPPRKNARSRD